ncbi:MAG: Gfo/Idh/MocA family oxidoreductase [Halanaerobiales bacterium]|nr:Gfo/Idh/MocA family oxidoreductase [Halanaerobiales bacterium]
MIKVGIIGAGFMGKTHGKVYNQLKNTELVGIADLSSDIGKQYAEDYRCSYYQNINELISREDIDIIDICLPTFLHEKYVIEAANEGKNILLEKPFTLTKESADRIYETVNKAGVKFMVGQVLRFWPEYVKIKDCYEQGDLGKMRMIYANRLAQMPNWSEWFQDESKSGGGLFDLHLHDIDYVIHLLGAVEEVYAVGQQSTSGWNHIISSLTFSNGVRACIEGSNKMTTNYPFTMNFRGTGDKGTIEFKFEAGFNLENRDSAQNSLVFYQESKSPRLLTVEKQDAYYNEIKYFADCVDNNWPIEVITLKESKYVLDVVLAIKKSLETGKVVKL